MCDKCRDLLNEALNLAVRGERMAQLHRREAALDASSDPEAWQADGTFDRYVARHNITFPHKQIASQSATMHLWVQDQYDHDLHDWEQKARNHLMSGCDRMEGQTDAD